MADATEGWLADNRRYIDGDTVVEDGQRVRLTGGDAPELAGRKGAFFQPQEGGADVATQWLRENLPEAEERLSRGRDIYGRELVEYRRGDENIMTQAVRAGVAFPARDNPASGQAADTSFFNRMMGNRTSWDERMDASRALNPPRIHFAADFDRSIRPEGWASRAIDRSFAQLEGTFGAAANYIGELTGFDGLAELGENAMTDAAVEAVLNPAEVASYEDVNSLNTLGTFIGEKVLENAGTIGSVIAGAATGGFGAAALGAGIGKAFLKRSLSKAAKTRLATIGARTGAATTLFPQHAGEAWQELREAGVGADETLAPFFVGAVNTVLDLAPAEGLLRFSFGGLSGQMAKDVVKENLKTLTAKGVLAEVAKGAAKGAGAGLAAEAPTEFAQELITLSARAYHDPEFDWDSPEVRRRLIDAAVSGGVVGFALGGAGKAAGTSFTSVRNYLKAQAEAAEKAEREVSSASQAAGGVETPPPAAPPSPPGTAATPPQTVPERPDDIKAQLNELAKSTEPGRVRFFENLRNVKLPKGLVPVTLADGIYVHRQGDQTARDAIEAFRQITDPVQRDAARGQLLGLQQSKPVAIANGAPVVVQGTDAQGNALHEEVVDSTNPAAVAGAEQTAAERGATQVTERDPREVVANRVADEPANPWGVTLSPLPEGFTEAPAPTAQGSSSSPPLAMQLGTMASGREPTGMAQPEELGVGSPTPPQGQKKRAQAGAPPPSGTQSTPKKPAANASEPTDPRFPEARAAAEQRISPWAPATPMPEPSPVANQVEQERLAREQLEAEQAQRAAAAPEEDFSEVEIEEVRALLAAEGQDAEAQAAEQRDLLGGQSPGTHTISGEPLKMEPLILDIRAGTRDADTVKRAGRTIARMLAVIRAAIPNADELEAQGLMNIPAQPTPVMESGKLVDYRIDGLALPPQTERPNDMTLALVRNLLKAAANGPTRAETRITLRVRQENGKFGDPLQLDAPQLVLAGDTLFENRPARRDDAWMRDALTNALAWLAQYGGYVPMKKSGEVEPIRSTTRVGFGQAINWENVARAIKAFPNEAEREIDALVEGMPPGTAQRRAIAKLKRIRGRLATKPNARLQVRADRLEREIEGLDPGSPEWVQTLETKRAELAAELTEAKLRRGKRQRKARKDDRDDRSLYYEDKDGTLKSTGKATRVHKIQKQLEHIERLFEKQAQQRNVRVTSTTRNFAPQTQTARETRDVKRTIRVPERRARGGERMRKAGFVKADPGVPLAPSRTVRRTGEQKVTTQQTEVFDSEEALRTRVTETRYRVIRARKDGVEVQNLESGQRQIWPRAQVEQEAGTTKSGTQFIVRSTSQESVRLATPDLITDFDEPGPIGDTTNIDDSDSDAAGSIVDTEAEQAARAVNERGDAQAATPAPVPMSILRARELERAKREAFDLPPTPAPKPLRTAAEVLPGTNAATLLQRYATGARKILEELGIRLRKPVYFTDMGGIDALLKSKQISDFNRQLLGKLKVDRPRARVLFLEDETGRAHPVIYISDKLATHVRDQAVLHELGHVVLRYALAAAPKEVIDALTTVLGDPREDPIAFEESFANYFVGWAGEKAHQVQGNAADRRLQATVRTYFNDLRRMLRNFFKFFRRAFQVNETFDDFMQALMNRNRRAQGETPGAFKTSLGRHMDKLMVEKGLTGIGALPSNRDLPWLDFGEPLPAAGRRRAMARKIARVAKTNAVGTQRVILNIWDKLLAPVDSRLRRMGQADYADEFRPQPGKRKIRKRLEFYAEERQVLARFVSRLEAIAKPHVAKLRPWHLLPGVTRPEPSPDMQLAFRALQGEAVTHTEASWQIAEALRTLLDDLHRWLNDHHVAVAHRKDYVPVAFAAELLRADGAREAFTKAVADWFATAEGQAWGKANLARGDTLTDKRIKTYTDGLYAVLSGENSAAAPLSTDEGELTFLAPGLKQSRRRKLHPGLVKALDAYREKDLIFLVNNYARTAVRRGLWQERFGGHQLEGNPLGEIVRAFDEARALGDPSQSVKAAAAWASAFKTRERLVKKFQQAYGVNIFDPSAKWKVDLVKRRRNGDLTDQQVKDTNDSIIPQLQGLLGIDAPEGWRRFQALAMTYQAARVLSFGMFAQFVDIGLIGSHVPAGYYGELTKSVRELFATSSREEMLRDGKLLGVITDEITEHMLNDIGGLTGLSRDTRLVNSWVFKMNGMHWMTNRTRALAVRLSKHLIARWVEDLGKPALRAKAEGYLAELGISPKAARDWVRDGGHVWDLENHAEVIGGLHQFVNQTVLQPDASMRGMIGNNAWVQILWQLTGFIWAMSTQVLQRAWNQSVQRWGEEEGLRKFYAAMPMILLGAWTLPFAALGLEIRWLLNPPERPPERDSFNYAFGLVERAGLLGYGQVLSSILRAESYGQFSLIAPLGPAVSQVDGWVRQDMETSLRKAVPFYAAIDGVRHWASEL